MLKDKEKPISFTKPGLKEYFDDRIKDKSLFVRPGNTFVLEEAEAHVQEWHEIYNKDIKAFKELNSNGKSNFNDTNETETSNPETKRKTTPVLTPLDYIAIKKYTRKRIMWCYLLSLDFRQLDGREIADLMIYVTWFVLNPDE